MKKKRETVIPINSKTDIYWEVFVEKTDLPDLNKETVYKLKWGFDWDENQILMTKSAIKRLINKLRNIIR